MPLTFVREDITRVKADALVDPTNLHLKPDGGVNASLFQKAGGLMRAACEKIAVCPEGKAVYTPGFDLDAKIVIHCNIPNYGNDDSEALLRSCYRSALKIAEENKLSSVAFPLLGAGNCGFPPKTAADIAVSEIRDHLKNSDLNVILVLFEAEAILAADPYADRIRQLIDDSYVQAHTISRENRFPNRSRINRAAPSASSEKAFLEYARMPSGNRKAGTCANDRASAPRPISPCDEMLREAPYEGAAVMEELAAPARGESSSLEELLKRRSESFSQMLLRLIDESGRKDSDVYNHANIDRKLFSKIRSNPNHHPKKKTAMAFAVALKLDLITADELLRSAGYAFSDSDRTDIIVRYYLRNRVFDVDAINIMLYHYDEEPLGA